MDVGAKFVKFEILNPSENQNLKSLTLDHKISIFDQNLKIEQIWWKFWRKSAKTTHDNGKHKWMLVLLIIFN